MKAIKKTRNYALFEYIRGNRPLGNRVFKMIKKIKRKNMSQDFPILVSPPDKKTGRMGILDGQTRFEALKRLEKEIFYIHADAVSNILDVSHANAVQRPWTPSDYVHSFSEQGNPNYIKLRDFILEFGLPVTTSVSLLMGVEATGGIAMESLREGKFQVKTSAEDRARRVGKVIAELKGFVPFATDRSLACAIVRLMEVKNFDPQRMLKKIKSQQGKFIKCASLEQYVDQIEEIYNHRVRAFEIEPLAIEVRKAMARDKEIYMRTNFPEVYKSRKNKLKPKTVEA